MAPLVALIVDDKEENLYLLRALLVGHGYEVELARHGAEALEQARRRLPDLVISDILMPVMDGFTLCRQWNADPVLKQIPFVFYTATYTDPKDERLALDLGAARFLIKPLEPEQFLTTILAVVEQHGRHELRVRQEDSTSEEQYLREYNQVLVHKLEDKLAQLQEANRRLADKDAFNQAVLNAIPALVAVAGPSGEILAVNQAWAQSVSCSDLPVLLRLTVGSNALAALAAQAAEPGDSADTRELLAGLAGVLEDRSPRYEIELSCRRGDARLWFMVRIERAGPAGTGAVIACIDITVRKQGEEAIAEASRRKDELLALLGHELRNPLAPIKSACEVLDRMELADARARSAREIIGRQTTHLARIVDGLVDISRITSGKIEIRSEPTDWSKVVRATFEDSRPRFASRGIELAVRLPREAVWVRGDATRLTQVLSNLLDNAQKFTSPGGRVEVELEIGEERSWGEMRVRDNGRGMSAETLSRVFQPFVHKAQGNPRPRGGFGLGLSLVKEIVDLHGGEVRAESAGPGRGSVLLVRLPLSEPPAGRLEATGRDSDRAAGA